MICDMSLTNITKKPIQGVILNCIAKCHLETPPLNSYSYYIIGTTSIFVTKSGRSVSGRSKTPESGRSTNVKSGLKRLKVFGPVDRKWTVQEDAN